MRTFTKYYLPVLLWMALIGVFSTNTFSGNLTLRLLRALMEFFDWEIARETLLQINLIVRKLAHITEFFILTLLVWRAERKEMQRLWNWGWGLATLALVVGTAAMDEAHQVMRQLRTGSVADIGIDAIGAVLALGWINWWTRVGTPPAQKEDTTEEKRSGPGHSTRAAD